MARLHWRFLLRFQIARVSYWRLQPFESPVVYRGEIALEIAAQIVKSRLKLQQNELVSWCLKVFSYEDYFSSSVNKLVCFQNLPGHS